MGDPKLQEYMDQSVSRFSEAQNEIADALQRIHAQLGGASNVQEVQLLALRRYIRIGGHGVALAWPWSKQQRDDHERESDDLKTEGDAVVTNFEKQNPGLSLGRSPIRSLARQCELWCNNASVLKAAAHILPRMHKELEKQEYPEIPIDWGPIDRFMDVLGKAWVSEEPTSAAPGTSDHGQDRAVDFVVTKNGRTIADTVKKKIKEQWEDTGYDKALKKATKDTKLLGPLPHPKEPWHYWLKKETK